MASRRPIKAKNRIKELKKIDKFVKSKMGRLAAVISDLGKDHVDDPKLAKSLSTKAAKVHKHLGAALEALRA